MSSTLTLDSAAFAGAQAGPSSAVLTDFLPLDLMQSRKAELKAAYEIGKPYPHVVFDNFWDPALLDRIIAEFPKKDQRDWIDYDTPHEMKQTSRGLFGLSPFTQLFLLQVCSPAFLNWLGEITGFKDLVPDPLYFGGGLHESYRGGWLNIHADYTKHPVLPMARRFNMIIYLNKDWDPAWGGALGLYDRATMKAGATVEPVFNRTVLFPTTPETLHGFPDAITCPADRTRQSISLFYWDRDIEALKSVENINFLPGKKTTRLRAAISPFVPPVLFRAMDKVSSALGPKS